MSKTFTCLFGLVLLVSVLTIGCGDDNNPGTPLTGTITIDPEPNSINAPWQITGPGGFDQSGVGDLTLNDMATGDYTLTWGVVSDWIAPSPETVTQELTADAAVTIGGIYLVNPYPFPDTAQKLMTTFMNAYDNMNIVEYRNVLHPDFKFKFAEGSDVEPSGYYTREQDLQTTTRMFNGEQGMSEIGEVMPGVRDIDFRLLEQLSPEWEAVPDTDPDFPGSTRAIFDVEIVFNLSDDGNSSFTVESQQIFYAMPVAEVQEDSSTRQHFYMIGQLDLDSSLVDNEAMSWSAVKALY